MVYHRLTDLDFALEDVPVLPAPRRVLLTTPDHFDVQYVINPHMEGHVGAVDPAAARRQWEALRAAYERLGLAVEVVEGQAGLCDMVFCANQTLPYLAPDGTRGVVPGRMRASQRRDEVPHVVAFFRGRGYHVERLPDDLDGDFEGMGDALWHPGRFLLWGGYGFRTDPGVYACLARRLGLRVLALALDDPDFYHLDTCFCVLDARSVMIYPGALRPEGLALIRRCFERIVTAPEDEARRLLACNAHCPDGRHVLIQRGCDETCRRLRRAGFLPVELDLSEFLKAGGSVFCMKQTWW